MTIGVGVEQRYTRSHPCPICRGWESADRGKGIRCWGFVSTDGEWARCTREDYAGALTVEDDSNAYLHRLHGPCHCGEQHGPSQPAGPQRSNGASGFASIIATYDYVDEHGEMLFQVVRKAGKKFLQRRPDGNGGWIWKLGDVRRVLYHLPEVIAASPDTPVYIVEGEKDVDALRAEGLVATCNAGGATEGRGKVRGEYAVHFQLVLKGRDVRIVADKDSAGCAHGEQLAALLLGHARSVKVLELPSHKDVSDFLDDGGTDRQLEELFDAVEARGTPTLSAVEVSPVADLTDRLWARGLVMNQDGSSPKYFPNLVLNLTHHDAWRGCFRYNEFADRLVWGRTGPTVSGFIAPKAGDDFSDHQAAYIAAWYANEIGPRFEKSVILDAMAAAARAHAFNPWRDFLLECEAKWDGQNRLDQWLTTYLGAPAIPVNLRIGPMWLIGAVARGLNPGCKMDYVLVLEGAQGARKSTALETLFGDAFYLPDLPNIRDKDAMHALSGVACACIDELSAMRAVDEEAKKSFLSRRIDRFRPPYGRFPVSRPRACVFSATTNVERYLIDPTGNRRFWPTQVEVTHPVDIPSLLTDRPQLFGEATVRYHAGEQWWPDASETLALREAQAERDQHDEWDPKIEKYIATRDWTTVGDCLSELGLEPKDWRPSDQHRVARALRRAGWRSVCMGRTPVDRPRRHWVPITTQGGLGHSDF